jgi:hypothetical protein
MGLAEEENFLPILSDSVKGQLAMYDIQVDKVVMMANQIKVLDAMGAEKALEFAGEARKIKKRIEGTRLKITEPYRDFVSEINATAKRYTERLDAVSKVIETKLTEWKYVQESNALAHDISASLEGCGDVLDLAIQDTKKIEARNCTAYEKEIWKYELEEICQVPIMYLGVDDNKVKLAIKNGVRGIPGLRIYKETVTQLRSR